MRYRGIHSRELWIPVSATIQSGDETTSVSGRLGGPTGRGYAVNDGFGLIDAFAAYLKLTGGAASGQ
jgi:hypothetical protein